MCEHARCGGAPRGGDCGGCLERSGGEENLGTGSKSNQSAADARLGEGGRRRGTEGRKGKNRDGGGNKQSSNGTDNRSNKGKKKQKDVAKNGNKNGNGGASNNKNKNKGAGGQQKGRGINAGGKLAAAARAPPGPRYVVHSMEDDPNSCSVM